MKTFGAIAMLCMAVALLSDSAYPQPSARPSQVAPQSLPKAEVSRDTKELALQAEVQVLKEFTQHILSTVYFALGTVVVVLVAMLGFGWYQHARVAEHEKEALRKELDAALKEGLERGTADIHKKMSEQVLDVDRKFGNALGLALRRLTELRLAIAADIFRATHTDKTPLTDFEVLSQLIRGSVGKAEPEALKHALSVLTEHLEAHGSRLSRTSLLELANDLPPECGAFAERIRELLSKQTGTP